MACCKEAGDREGGREGFCVVGQRRKKERDSTFLISIIIHERRDDSTIVRERVGGGGREWGISRKIGRDREHTRGREEKRRILET